MCVFCKIIAGELPSYKVYEDEQVLAILDIKPIHAGHILVLPKKHVTNLEEISEVDLSNVVIVVKKMGGLLKDKLSCVGYNVIENNDLVAGQEIPHLHFHLIPRLENDGLNHWARCKYRSGEAEEVLKKLKS